MWQVQGPERPGHLSTVWPGWLSRVWTHHKIYFSLLPGVLHLKCFEEHHRFWMNAASEWKGGHFIITAANCSGSMQLPLVFPNSLLFWMLLMPWMPSIKSVPVSILKTKRDAFQKHRHCTSTLIILQNSRSPFHR